MDSNKVISIFGSTGSIGVQTLEVISKTENYEVNSLTTNTNIDLLENQCKIFNPKSVVICDNLAYNKFKQKTEYKGKIYNSKEGFDAIVEDSSNDLIVSTLVGFAGVIPTIKAIRHNIDIALANKETLIAAGHIIKNELKINNVKLYPIDSEHSAIQQCLVGENINEVEKIILTASGGPFLNTPVEDFDDLTIEQALNHPNWSMGSKISIDSATMMNKGLEVIETHWLFDVEPKNIDIVIHPQSIIHSMVQFVDGSVKAQLGLPDMKVPISYALSLPNRLEYNFERLDLTEISNLEFYKPDFEKFPNLRLAYSAIEMGGNIPCALNAANEIAVNYFLNKKIKFSSIPEIIEYTMQQTNLIENPSLDEIIETNSVSRDLAENYIKENYGISK